MVGVQDEDLVHGAGQGRADLGFLARVAEHHVQEVFRITEVVARIHQRLTETVLVAHGRDGGHLRDQTERGDFPVGGVIDVQRVVIKRGQCPHHATHDGHRVRVAAEAVEQIADLLVHHGVVFDGADKGLFLLGGGQFTVEQEVAHFKIVRLGGQFLDGIAPMQQFAHFTVDEGDL